MQISFSKQAGDHIIAALAERGRGLGLRVSIKASGCSGFKYVVDYADQIDADDVVFADHQTQVVVDKKSLALIEGTHIDYQSEGLNKQLVFNNPRVAAECGCGESFSLVDDQRQQ